MNRVITILLLSSVACLSQAQIVKQSRHGICHDPSSPNYRSLKYFKSFNSLQACLKHHGRRPKNVHHSSEAPLSGSHARYARAEFGHGWADTDHDCQNSRTEALIRQSTGQVTFKTDRHCRVIKGRWISPYSGQILYEASQIDIDHIVPLSWAWQHGANHWTSQKRKRFANDPSNLVSVEASLNRQKGDKGPEQWLPPKNQCAYLSRFKRITKKYDLPFHAILLKTHCKHDVKKRNAA